MELRSAEHDIIALLNRTGVRASICAVAAFLLFTFCALSRVSLALSAVRFSTDGQRGRGRFLMLAEEKVCCLCKEAKPTAEFYKSKTAKDGLFSSCKPC